jgi:hypothetical protein
MIITEFLTVIYGWDETSSLYKDIMNFMEEIEKICPQCHVTVRPTDYFCYNCGHNLQPVPPSISLADQLALYIKSILLPPFGVLWAIKYLKQNSNKSKIVGLTAIILTLVSLLVCSILFKNLADEVNNQITNQLNTLSY